MLSHFHFSSLFITEGTFWVFDSELKGSGFEPDIHSQPVVFPKQVSSYWLVKLTNHSHRPLKNKSCLEDPVPSVKCKWEITLCFWMIVHNKLCRWRRSKSFSRSELHTFSI
jgi:hypothetical protein